MICVRPDTEDAVVGLVADLPNAGRLRGPQGLGRLHTSGWMEGAILFGTGGLASGSAARRLPACRPPTHPDEMLLEEFLKPLGMSQSAFVRRLGVSYPRLNEIVRGKRSVTPDTALRLARVTGMGADFRLGLQQDWDLWHALTAERAAAIASLEPLPRLG